MVSAGPPESTKNRPLLVFVDLHLVSDTFYNLLHLVSDTFYNLLHLVSDTKYKFGLLMSVLLL